MSAYSKQKLLYSPIRKSKILNIMSAAGYILNKSNNYHPVIDSEIEVILNDFEGAYAFHQTISEYKVTPLVKLPALSKLLNLGSVFVKDESARFGTSALKILGASYAINKARNADSNIKGICTATDGNHGRAVAWVSKKHNLPTVVFVPHHTVSSRIKYIEDEGATVIVSKGEYDKAVSEASAYAKKNNFALIQDTSWSGYQETPATITAGYYTQLQEVAIQTNKLHSPKIDVVFIQAGVGSWPSAVVHFLRNYLNSNVKIVCVEPFESDAIYESVKRDALASTRKSQKTIMAGLNCGTPSSLAFEILKNGTDAFLIISDAYAIDAIKYLNAPLPGDPYIAAGESGAAGLAGLLAVTNNPLLIKLKEELGLNSNSNILVFNTENVTNPLLLNDIMKELEDNI